MNGIRTANLSSSAKAVKVGLVLLEYTAKNARQEEK